MDGESINAHVVCFSSTTVSQWVAQNLQEVNQIVDFMLKIIEKTDTNHQKRLELTSLINGINQKHQLLGQKFEEQTISTSKLQNQLELYEKEMGLLKANLDYEKNRAFELQEKIKRHAENELKIEFLENEIKKCEALKGEMKDLFQAQEMHWHNKEVCLKAELNEKNKKFEALNNNFDRLKLKFDMLISEKDGLNSKLQTLNAELCSKDTMIQQTECLKTELNKKSRKFEALNKNFDGLKLKFDMLISEKDGLNAKIQTLNAELCSKDNMIQQTESRFHQLHLQNVELNASRDIVLRQKDELILKVEELEREIKGQEVMLTDMAEEKREAIRQLCISLEHYRNGYQQLRKACTGQWRSAMPAS